MPPRTIPAPAESEIELTLEHEGTTYKLFRGDVYKVGPEPGRLTFFESLYDPDFFAKNYAVVDGVPNKRDLDSGKLYPTRRQFEEGFEDATGLKDLIGPRAGLDELHAPVAARPHGPRVQRPATADPERRGDFLDNRIEVSREAAHSGSSSLKCYLCRSFTRDDHRQGLAHDLADALRQGRRRLVLGLVPRARGAGLPLTLVDLESTWINEHPGMRIMLDPPGFLMAELKWADKPTYRQPQGREIRFPVGRWVHVELHLRLSEKADGLVELRQDGVPLVDGHRPNAAAGECDLRRPGGGHQRP